MQLRFRIVNSDGFVPPVVLPDKREAHLSHAAAIDAMNSKHFDKRGHAKQKRSEIYIHRNFARYMETIIAMQRLGAEMPSLPTAPHTRWGQSVNSRRRWGVSWSPAGNVNSSPITARINGGRRCMLFRDGKWDADDLGEKTYGIDTLRYLYSAFLRSFVPF